MMMKIDEIWNSLANDSSFSGGLLLRRYSGAILPNIFVGIRSAEKSRCIVIRVSYNIDFSFEDVNKLKDIFLEFRIDDLNPEYKLLIVELKNVNLTEVFSTVCEDLISKVCHISDDSLLVIKLLDRFEKWIHLFDIAKGTGLSNEAQRGLYGELYFLRKWLYNSCDNYLKILHSWLGPEGSIQDFQMDDWAVEVKTTSGNNHQRIYISNERQLDAGAIRMLFLYHISLTVLQHSDGTLNSIIDEIRSTIGSNIKLQSIFESKLIMAGYFNSQRKMYDNTGYEIRGDIFYRVFEDFPRIEESDLRTGIGDVRYSIIISNCQNYIVSDEHLFKTIN